MQNGTNYPDARYESNSELEATNDLRSFDGKSGQDRLPTTSQNENRIVVVDAEVHFNERPIQNCTYVRQKSNKSKIDEDSSHSTSHLPLLPCSDAICTVESPSHSSESFKLFSRRYLLHKTLDVVNKETDETKYNVYKNHLLNIEKYFDNSSSNDICSDLVVALKNAWYLFHHSDNNGSEDLLNSPKSSTRAVSNKDTENVNITKLISTMLSLAAKDEEYCHCLTKLCNIEYNL